MVTKSLLAWSLVAIFAAVGCTQQEKSGMSGMHMGGNGGNTDLKAALATGAVDLGNTVCPVSGDKVGESEFIEVYQGKIYHFCCDMCPADFKNDPAKYAALVAADPAKFGVKH